MEPMSGNSKRIKVIKLSEKEKAIQGIIEK